MSGLFDCFKPDRVAELEDELEKACSNFTLYHSAYLHMLKSNYELRCQAATERSDMQTTIAELQRRIAAAETAARSGLDVQDRLHAARQQIDALFRENQILRNDLGKALLGHLSDGITMDANLTAEHDAARRALAQVTVDRDGLRALVQQFEKSDVALQEQLRTATKERDEAQQYLQRILAAAKETRLEDIDERLRGLREPNESWANYILRKKREEVQYARVNATQADVIKGLTDDLARVKEVHKEQDVQVGRTHDALARLVEGLTADLARVKEERETFRHANVEQANRITAHAERISKLTSEVARLTTGCDSLRQALDAQMPPMVVNIAPVGTIAINSRTPADNVRDLIEERWSAGKSWVPLLDVRDALNRSVDVPLKP